MANTVVARAEHRFERLGAEAVYEAWVDPDRLRVWMEHHLKAREGAAQVTRIEVDPVVGGRFFFADSREGGEAWGDYRVLEKPRRIVFSWFVTPEEEEEDMSLVTLEIEPQGAGCLAVMSHEMSAEWADYIEPTARAWGSMLKAIDETF